MSLGRRRRRRAAQVSRGHVADHGEVLLVKGPLLKRVPVGSKWVERAVLDQLLLHLRLVLLLHVRILVRLFGCRVVVVPRLERWFE